MRFKVESLLADNFMREKQMKIQARAILKKIYYRSMFIFRKMFIPKHYRFEINFIENIRAETYSDIFYKQAKLRSLTHQLDKILTFNKVKNMDLMVNTIIKLSNDVMQDPNHDLAIINWCNNVVKEYNSRSSSIGNIATNTEKIKFDNKDFELLKKIIKSRRSIRSFKTESINKEILYEILGAGLWAPSGCNRQTIEYLCLVNKDDIRYCQRIAGEGYPFPQEASLAIVVLVDPRNYALPNQRHMAYLEGGAAIQNILLTAHSLNIGSCWLFWDGKVSNHDEFIRKFNLSSWLLPVSMVCLGYADKTPQYCPERKDLSKSIHNLVKA
jgi:nitroreductase